MPGNARASVRDVEIIANSDGRPVVMLPIEIANRGYAAEVSISHDSGIAVARESRHIRSSVAKDSLHMIDVLFSQEAADNAPTSS